jgi:hypothetical protein
MAPEYPEDRLYDQQQFEKALAESRDAFYKAILSKNESMARFLAGVPPAGLAPTINRSPARAQRTTAEVGEDFDEYADKFAQALRRTGGLPSEVKEEWISRLKTIDLYEPAKALDIVANLLTRLDLARDRYRPRPNVFNLDVEPIMKFAEDMGRIEAELKWLRGVLESVQAYLQEHPEERPGS